MTTDILVAGAGPAGLATARALALAGRSVTVLDADPASSAGSGLTLWPNALAALRQLGIPGVQEAARPCAGMRVSRPDGSVLQYLDPDTMTVACGGNGHAITRAALMAELRKALPDSVTVHAAVLRSVELDGELVRAGTDQGGHAGRVLVGADGAHSTVRRVLTGEDGSRRLGMRVIRGLSTTTLADYPAQVTMGRGVQFGIFALSEGTYWFAAYPASRALASAADSVRALFAGWHQPIEELVATTPAECWLSHDVFDRKPPGAVWGRAAVTLVGDAAHLAAPTMGQGTCHAFEDALALANALAGTLEPAALRRYEAARAPRATALVKRSHLAAVAGQWRSPLVCAGRDLMMKATPARSQIRQLRTMFTFSAADVLAASG